MRPVSADWEVTQPFGSYATGGVVANEYGTEVQQLVYQYGNYQPYGHAGTDIACPVGTPVHAIQGGTVLWADWGTNLPGDETDTGYRQRWYLYKTFPGIVTVIQHNGWISVYAHLSEAPLNPGDVVTEGQQIALSGNTRSPGVSLGAHLHVEALIDNTYSTGNGLIYGRTDPTPYFGAVNPQSITEDPMPTLDEIWNYPITIGDKSFTAADVLRYANINAASAARLSDIARSEATNAKTAAWDVPAKVLNQQFKLPDGTVTNLSGILAAINAKPVTGGAAVVDPQAIADAVIAGTKAQWSK